jgi:hypothetical protein
VIISIERLVFAGLLMCFFSGAEYIAAARTILDLPCKIRVTVRNTWNEWKTYIFGKAPQSLIIPYVHGVILYP